MQFNDSKIAIIFNMMMYGSLNFLSMTATYTRTTGNHRCGRYGRDGAWRCKEGRGAGARERKGVKASELYGFVQILHYLTNETLFLVLIMQPKETKPAEKPPARGIQQCWAIVARLAI